MAKLHHNVKDLTGQIFGFLTVEKYAGGKRWIVRCACGKKKDVFGANLKNKTTISCGCRKQALNSIAHRTHGMDGTTEYRIWVNMKYRCLNPNSANYHRYGGRGITVCHRWEISFSNFFADMGRRPSTRHSLDRIDNTKGYSPENCRWATQKEQLRNKRNNRLLTCRGKTQTIAEWAEEVGVSHATIRERLRRRWSIEKALYTQV